MSNHWVKTKFIVKNKTFQSKTHRPLANRCMGNMYDWEGVVGGDEGGGVGSPSWQV